MKKIIAEVINLFLSPFKVKLVKNTHDQFSMTAGLKRIVDHGIKVKDVVDIGASNGKWSRNALRFFPEVKCLAIEPLNERAVALQALKEKQQSHQSTHHQ